MSSLGKHLNMYNRAYQVNKGKRFPNSIASLKVKMSYLKSQGFDNRTHEADELTYIDIDKLFNANPLGHTTLLCRVGWNKGAGR